MILTSPPMAHVVGRYRYLLDSSHPDYSADLAAIRIAFAKTHPGQELPMTVRGVLVEVSTYERVPEVTGTVLRALLPWVERHPGSVVEVTEAS